MQSAPCKMPTTPLASINNNNPNNESQCCDVIAAIFMTV